MHRARFSYEPSPELLEDCIAGNENPPEAVGVFGIVRGMYRVLIERDRVRNFNWHLPYFYLDPERGQRFHELAIEVRDGTRGQCKCCAGGMAGLNDELVMDEVEKDFEHPASVRDWGGGQPDRIDVERYF